ncbi:MAG: hypothetical protein ABJM06_10700 [Gilvibacter sp.]
MLTRIFATSKPLNYLLIGGYVFLVFVLQLSFDPATVFDFNLLVKALAGFAAIFFSILLLDFIVRKNTLSRPNTYIVLVYGGLIALLPIWNLLFALIIAQILLFLGIRRSISLRSQKRSIKKIFDAAFWFSIASLFYFWSAVYIVALFAAILYFSSRDYRYWLLPLFGVAVVLLLYFTGYLLWFDTIPQFTSLIAYPDFDFRQWTSDGLAIVPSIYLSLGLLCGLLFYYKLRKMLFKLKRVQLYCILMLILVGAAAFIGPKSQPESWILLSFPLAVVAGNVIQENTHRIITEVLLWALVLSPVLLTVML